MTITTTTTTTMTTTKRIAWACRRGMLELDILLSDYFTHTFERLSPKQQQVFERLLSCTDPELFAWLMGHETPADAELAAMINQIKQHADAQLTT